MFIIFKRDVVKNEFVLILKKKNNDKMCKMEFRGFMQFGKIIKEMPRTKKIAKKSYQIFCNNLWFTT